MKTARAHYSRLARARDDHRRAEIIAALKGPELAALWNYALGREPGETRDAILLDVIMQSGKRYLCKQQARKAKRIF